MKDLIESILTITDDPRRDYRSDDDVEKKLFELLTKQLHKPVVVRGGDYENQFVQNVGKYFDYKNVTNTPNTPTEPLPAEGLAKSVCGEKPAHNWTQLVNDDIICTECGMRLRA